MGKTARGRGEEILKEKARAIATNKANQSSTWIVGSAEDKGTLKSSVRKRAKARATETPSEDSKVETKE